MNNMDSTVENDIQEEPTKWTKKLSQKLKRRSREDDGMPGRVSKGNSAPSQNPFARNYVPPSQSGTPRRGTSTDHGRSSTVDVVTDAGNKTPDAPTGFNSNTISSGQMSAASSRPITANSNVDQTVNTMTISSTRISSGDHDESDDFVGLDMNGKARRRSDTNTKQSKFDKYPPSTNPFARNYVGTNFSQPLGRRFQDEQMDSNDSRSHSRPHMGNEPSELPVLSSSREGSDFNPNAGSEHFVSHKATDSAIDNADTVDHSSSRIRTVTNAVLPEIDKDHMSALPIFAEFTNRQSRQAADRSSTSTLILPSISSNKVKDPKARESSTDDTNMEAALKNLSIQSPDALSPASFASAQNYFDPKPGERCVDFKDQEHPTAEEILERAKYSSVDTTLHETVAPAVTHEVIENKVHEIIEERITRDIHHYHHLHRILPVHDVEILPAKHFRIVDGVQVEMKAEEVPQSRVDAWQSAIIPKISV